MENEIKTSGAGKQKKIIIIIAIATLLAVVAIVSLVLANASGDRKVSRKMLSAEKYFTALDYDSAIAEYSEILGMDSANVQAYLGLIKAYVALENYDEAKKILEAAKQNVSDQNALDYMDYIIKSAEPPAPIVPDPPKQPAKPPVVSEVIVPEEPLESDISVPCIPVHLTNSDTNGNFFYFSYTFDSDEIDGIKIAECDTYISNYFKTEDDIVIYQEDLQLNINSWKNAGLFKPSSSLSGTQGFMIEDEYSSLHGENVTVYLLTINSNYEPVGYSIVEVNIP